MKTKPMLTRENPFRGKPLKKSPDFVHPLIKQLNDVMITRRTNQHDVGAVSGVSHKTIAGWRMGAHDPRLHDFVALANTLGFELVLLEKQGDN